MQLFLLWIAYVKDKTETIASALLQLRMMIEIIYYKITAPIIPKMMIGISKWVNVATQVSQM